MKKISAKDRTEWRAWLSANHDKVAEVWLIFYKKETGKTSVEYGASVEEALCFGWVDSIIKNLDETKYARKFTPRRPHSKWSPSNIKRVEKLIEEGLMTGHGMQKVEAAKRDGNWDHPVQKPELTFEIPPEFSQALNRNKAAKENFDKLATTYQKQYIESITCAAIQRT
ncbi:MAG: YdeI family protein [bacterium]